MPIRFRHAETPQEPAAKQSDIDQVLQQPENAEQENMDKDNEFLDWYLEEDESDNGSQPRRLLNNNIVDKHKNAQRKLEELYAESVQGAQSGGLSAARFITADFLLTAPEDFFDEYEHYTEKTTVSVQNAISNAGKSNIISAAQEDPTDQEKQEAAFHIIRNYAIEYLEKSPYHGMPRAVVINQVIDEIIGFSKLDPLWRDNKITEILCNGPRDIQVEISGTLRKVPACKFRDKEHLRNLVERLYRGLGKTVSRMTPIVDGRLHDNSRLSVVHDSVAPDGPNFTIRRHREKYISPQDIINWGTADEELMTFLGNLIYKGCSILISGGTSTGKTTLLGSLSGFLRPEHRILTLEDSLELKLAPNKFTAPAMECQPARPDQPHSGVDMRALVKASLRLRPDAIILGEVRDDAAWDLCQALNTGHYGLSTVHANSVEAAIYRLQSLVSQGGLSQGEGVLPLIGASFDFIVQIGRFPTGGRKILKIAEVAALPVRDPNSHELRLPLNPLWEFKEEGMEGLEVKGSWKQIGEISPLRRELRMLDLESDLPWEKLKELSSSS